MSYHISYHMSSYMKSISYNPWTLESVKAAECDYFYDGPDGCLQLRVPSPNGSKAKLSNAIKSL